MNRVPRIAITAGEPAGIGPDLCVALSNQALAAELVILADPDLLESRARELGESFSSIAYKADTPAKAGNLLVEPVPVASPVHAGTLNPANAASVLSMLDRAIEGCLKGEFDAMVTAPVHKGLINDAGIPFTGHTEYLAANTNTAQVVMMLTAPGLRVALATTHLPLSEVPSAITSTSLTSVLHCLHNGLESAFGLSRPRILVAGLNPHAGESGHLGHEEADVIEPVLKKLKAQGMNLTGPLPADTLFTPGYLEKADAVLAMYHDQGLPVLKHLGFGQAVNITLGLPFIRTSVDHGTALDLAASGKAGSGSLLAAIRQAIEMTDRLLARTSHRGAR